MQYVQVRINEQGALRNQRYAFTNRYTLVSELMQNARRAGATEIVIDYDERTRVLSLADDGRGIEDLQKLLTFNESGWDEATCAAEQPFGIGFSKCLYAASRCVVNSAGHQIDFDTEAALAQAPIEVVSVLDQPGTSIVLFGVELPQLGERLTRLCRGFPVAVRFNGVEIDRPYAPERLSLIDTDVGMVHLAGIQDGKASRDTLVFLQGLCVIDVAFHAADGVNIVHLDPARFLARLPDRDTLIDEDEQRKRIEAALRVLWRGILIARKAELPPEAFCERFFAAAQRWGCTDVFDDVPVLPRELCRRILGYPYREGYGEADYLAPCEAAITRERVESGGVRLCEIDAPDDDSVALWMYARAHGFVVLNAYALAPTHWVQAHVRRLEGLYVDVEALGEHCHALFEGRGIQITVLACESYSLTVGGERIEITSEAIYDAPNARVLVPREARSGRVCRQVSDYLDEHDHWNEADQEADIAALEDLIRHLRAVDPRATLRSLIHAVDLENYPLLWGKTFRVRVGTSAQEHAIDLME